MDYNLIDTAPMFPGWGVIYQGGQADASVQTLPGPMVIVCMDLGEANEQFVDHKSIQGVIYIGIDDAPDAVLDNKTYLAYVDICLLLLKTGFNLYVHCAAGVSRASYMDLGIHMRALKIGYDDALVYIRKGRPQANPNSGFELHLRQLQETLKNG